MLSCGVLILKKHIKSSNFTVDCNTISHEASRDLCFTELAKDKGKLEICNNIANDFKYECYKEVAIVKKDDKICEAIPPSEQTIHPQERKWFCLKQVGIEKADPTVCDKITHPQVNDECYAGIIVKTGNKDLCSHFDFEGKVPPVNCIIFTE